MTDEERRALAQTCAATWSYGPTLGVWFDVLEGLDRIPAHKAYRALRDSELRAPTVAAFVARYRELEPKRLEPRGCERCDQTGYRPAPDRVVLNAKGDEIHRYRQVVNCDCPLGRASWHAGTLEEANR